MATPQSVAITFDSFALNAPFSVYYYGSPESSNATATSFSTINPDNAPFYLLSLLDYNGGGAIDVYISYQIIKL